MPAVIAVGLAARFGLSGTLADAVGGALYTVLVYVLIALIWPRASPAAVALAALGCSVAIEVFQLTPIPADLGDAFPPFKLVFGSAFVATDLIAYAAGALLAASVDRAASVDSAR